MVKKMLALSILSSCVLASQAAKELVLANISAARKPIFEKLSHALPVRELQGLVLEYLDNVEPATIMLPNHDIYAVCLSRDCNEIACGSVKSVYIIDIKNRKNNGEKIVTNFDGNISSISILPNGDFSARADNHCCYIMRRLENNTFTVLSKIASDKMLKLCASMIINSGTTWSLQQWFIQELGTVAPKHTAFSPSGKYGAMRLRLDNVQYKHRPRIWNEPNLIDLDALPNFNHVLAMKFSPDEKFLITGHAANADKSEGTVKIWKLDGKKVEFSQTFKEPKNGIEYIATSSATGSLAIACLDNVINIYVLQDEHYKHKQQIKTGKVSSLSFSLDGKYLAAAVDNRLALFVNQKWELEQNQENSNRDK